MKGEKVSAIVTTHNRLNYLKKAINSIESQSYKNIEIIVVDDGSDDGTDEYCLSKENIKYIHIPQKDHKNGNYARNLGIKASTGKYIAFLDDDDEWFNDKIQKQVVKINENKKYGVVYTGIVVQVNDGIYYYNIDVKEGCFGDCSEKSLYIVFSTTSTMLFTRKALYDVGLFDENLDYWQETELMIRISQKYLVACIDENLILYRQKLNDSKQLTNNLDGFINSVEYINEKHKDIINNLNKLQKKRRKMLIYQDIANRCTSLKMNIKSRKYLFKILIMFPSIKKLAKFILNYTSPTQLKLKMFLHRKKERKQDENKN